jgi:2-oxoglutarate ferredoxin oxidoreductase subunit alpha
MLEDPYKKTGMVVLQAESEVASINMVYGGAACAKRVMTTSSSPGVSLMQEGLSYIAGAELPCLVVNVVRGGPGLGTIQPSQADYFQTTKGGGHGDYRLITLAPASVQEMYDFVGLGFELAFKYRNPAMILSDGLIGQVMEKVVIDDYTPRWTDEYIKKNFPWATTGKNPNQPHVIVTSLQLESAKQEQVNLRIQAKYKECERDEVRYELIHCEDAEYLFVAYGSSARICQKAIELGRAKGIKVGLVRPITLWPFPTKILREMSQKVKGMLSVEMSAGQMVEDVLLATQHKVKVEHFGRFGGIIPTPHEVLDALETKIIGG